MIAITAIPAPAIPAAVVPGIIPSPRPAVPGVIIAIAPAPVWSPAPVGTHDEVYRWGAVEVILNEVRVVAAYHDSGVVKLLYATSVGKLLLGKIHSVALIVIVVAAVILVNITTVDNSREWSNLGCEFSIITRRWWHLLGDNLDRLGLLAAIIVDVVLIILCHDAGAAH
jgi:hypothetical protein